MVIPVEPGLLAITSMNLGTALKASGRGPEAAERFRESISALEALVRESPGDPLFRNNLAAASFNLANLQLSNAVGAGHWRNYERARGLWEGLVREFPSAAGYSDSLVGVYGTLGVLYGLGKRFEEARTSLDRARDIGELAGARPPDLPSVPI